MRRDELPLVGILLLSAALNVTASWWGLPSRFAWAPDELQPPIILQGIEERFSGDWHQPAYPPFHYYLLAASYVPLLATDAVEPASVDTTRGRTVLYWLGRLISLAMGVGTLVLIYRIGTEVFSKLAGVFAALVAATSATFVYYAKFANLDVPAAFWVLWSLLYFIRHLKTDEPRDRHLFALLAVVAMCTKDQAYAFYVLPVGVYLVQRARRTGTLIDRDLLWTAALATAAFLVLHNAWFNFWGFVHHFEEILWARSHYSSFEADGIGQANLFVQSLRHSRFALGWPFLLAAIGGVWVWWGERRSAPLAWWILAAALSYYLFFVAPVRSTWLRYIVPLSLLAAVFAGRGLAFVWSRGRWARALVVGSTIYSVAYAASVDILLLNDSRYTVEAWLSERVTDDEIVGFMGPEYYLPRLDGLPSRRLRPTESVLERSRPDYLVVNPDYAERFQPGSREEELFTKLRAGRAGYGLRLRHQSDVRPMLLDFDGILGNMAKINPVIEVYQRAD